MPNGGPTPDCMHCQFWQGDINNPQTTCTKHKIKLVMPIRVFCSSYVDPEPDDNGDWLDQRLDRELLQPDWMYLWLDFSEGEEDWKKHGIKSTFEHFPLASISDYAGWTRENVFETMRRIYDARLNK